MNGPGRSVVWTGRGSPGTPRGLDGWNTSPSELVSLLEDAHELVITEPLSFPWRHVPPRLRAIPMTITVPSELTADEVAGALGQPLLRHLTGHDRIVGATPEVRTGLTQAFGLPEHVWDGPGDDLRVRREAKARQYDQVAVVRDSVRRLLSQGGDKPLIGFLGSADELAGPVAAALGADHASYPVASETPDAAPHALVVRLDDGGQTGEQRLTLLGRAAELLHPGGRLVVVGYVVDGPRGANPSISRLVEELLDAFGGMVHVEELRSVPWHGESAIRGVVVGASSLRVGLI